INELQGLFAHSLLELDRDLARGDLTPKDLASIAHRIKGEDNVEQRTDEPEHTLAPGPVLSTEPASARPLTIET
ncbi:hypothetical protein RMT89_45115, partial [Streptomyces sp. P17]|nr:hypothetical protein [Streptomyces sp. P17]